MNTERRQLIKSGFNRFYSEGFTKWSEENVKKIFDGELGSDEVGFLQSLEDKGYIKLVGEADCFVLILNKIDEL
ncbi:hypothetical protein [Aliidiomarina soli]|uniref:Uncharacterized protein n=1 Tax=Aliidiomarina soli TaxID=1928574 RepID=A0A432WE19_9GAMM|nr:hypothetical protein [Aliidiomarina soli]RUO31143.1 hypothetical protein CWE14_11650 [Aliidiomarina soli]